MLTEICAFVRFFTGVQVRWIGIEPKPIQRIYFANHTSHLDCMVLLSVLPANVRKLVRPAAAADYWTSDPVRLWFSQRVLHVVTVERNNLNRANNPIKKLVGILDEGSSLIIFPEGGRGDQDCINAFKGGIYHLSKARPDVELVPVFIDNANRILPKGEFIPIPFVCSVSFGAPMHLIAGERKEVFLDRAKQAVERLAS
jgi:1-acyl-sn-glycerol-3-phosphate acyltransferase